MKKKISILAFGSRGDVQPYLALGLGLKKVGYEILIVTSKDFTDFVSDYDLPTYIVDINIKDVLNSKEGISLLESGNNLIKSMPLLSKFLNEFIEKIMLGTIESCKDVDLIICSSLAFCGFSVGEKYNIPFLYAILQPILRTSEFPFFGIPSLPIPFIKDFYNKATYILTEQIVWQVLRKNVNRIREEKLNLKPLPFFGSSDYFYGDKNSIPVLCGYSKSVLQKPKDWLNNHHITGYWYLEKSKTWEPDKALLDFIAAGEPPIYIGFGSMRGDNPEKLAKLVISSLKKSGQRGILSKGWGGLSGKENDESIFYIDSVPHDWLFPKMKAVIHHGGAGTTSAAIKSGRPMIIIPFFTDQILWAERVNKLGIGLSIPLKKLNEINLTKKINIVINEPSIISKSERIALEINNEDGISNAIHIIEKSFY